MSYLCSALGGIALIIAAFFYGQHVQATADKAQVQAAVIKQDSKLNALTTTQTLAAATHVQAIQAHHTTIHDRIQALPAPTTRGSAINATFSPACAPDPFDDAFRVLYDAGSTGQPPD